MPNKLEQAYTEATVCFPMRGNQVLVAEKQKKLGAGHLNGFGGKAEPQDTSIEATNIRETMEEVGIEVQEAHEVAEIIFHNPMRDRTLKDIRVHFFIATQWLGEPVSTEEMMHPTWHNVDSLDYDQFLAGDRLFIPQILTGKKLSGTVTYDDDWSVQDARFEEVQVFEH